MDEDEKLFQSRVLLADALRYLSLKAGKYEELETEKLYDRYLFGGISMQQWLQAISGKEFDFVNC